MSEDLSYEIVCTSPLGIELEKNDCEALAKIISTHTLSDGEVLFTEGRIDDSLHVIIRGHLAVTRNTGGGDYITLHILKSGNFAGEMGFVDGKEHSATLRAVGETEVFSLKRQDLESLVEGNPNLIYQVMRAIIRAVHSNLLRMNQQFVEMNNYITKEHGRY
ncbi:MAG: cyclic nucleotide-binding domain-containing protein [Pseudomonadota bacterium]